MREITIPISDETIRSLKVGEPVLLDRHHGHRARRRPQVDDRDLHQEDPRHRRAMTCRSTKR